MNQPMGKIPPSIPTNYPPHPASASRCRLQTAPGGFQGDSKLRRASQLWSFRSWSCQGLPKTPEVQRRIFFEGKVKEKMVDVFLKKTRADPEQIVFFFLFFFSNGFAWSRWGCFCVSMWRSESHQNHQVSWTHRWLPVKRMGRLSTWLAAKQIPAVHGLGEISTRAMWCAMASNYKIPWGKCKCLVKNDTCTCNLPIFTRV